MGAAAWIMRDPCMAFFGLAFCMLLLIIGTFVWMVYQYWRH